MADEVLSERTLRADPIVSAHRRAHRIEADMRARSVVAKGETPASEDGLLITNACDGRRPGAGDDEPAIRARMGADAGGRRIVPGLDAQELRQSRRDPRLVARAFEPGEPEADRDRSGVGLIEPGVE